MPHLVSKYEANERLSAVIKQCCEVSGEPRIRNYYRLLSFISASSRPSQTEEQLVEQLKELTSIVSDCEQEGQVQSNALTVMKCMVAMLSLSSQQLEEELSMAADNRYATTSDQILINYFEVMRAYKEVENNYQAEGVFEDFT